MAIKAKIKWNQIALAKLNKAMLVSAEQAVYAVRTDVSDAHVVPRAVGTLEDTSFIDSTKKARGEFRLVYSTPYARRLYWHPEYNFRDNPNAHARGEWLEPWLTGDKRRFAREAFIKRLRANAGLR